MDILIDASRNRSGGAISHILGILNDGVNPSVYGINKIYICSYSKLLNRIEDKPWLHKVNHTFLEKSIFHQLLWQIFILPMRLSKSVYVGTSVIAFSYVNAIKIPPYFFLGQINLDTLQIAFYLIFPAALAVYFGYQLVRLISDNLFFIIVSWALLMISLKLIWDSLNSAF